MVNGIKNLPNWPEGAYRNFTHQVGVRPSRMHEGAMKKKRAGQQCQDRCAEGSGSVIQGTDPRIRICTKMSRI
jgi:hypothetical protein